MRRVGRFFKYLVLGILIAAVPTALQIVVSLFVGFSAAFLATDLSLAELDAHIVSITLVVASSIAIGIAVLVGVVKGRPVLAHMNIRRIPATLVVPCLLLGLTIGSAFDFSYFDTSLVEQSNAYMDSIEGGFLNTLDIVLLGPVVEELFYRGFSLNVMRRGMPAPVAIVICAFLFGLGHIDGGVTYVIDTMAMGVVFGWLAVRTGSIVPGIIAHVANNVLAMLLGSVTTSIVGVVALNVAALASVALIVIWIAHEPSHVRETRR